MPFPPDSPYSSPSSAESTPLPLVAPAARPSLTPIEFVHKWANHSLKERSAYQSHFIDICKIVGHPPPTDFDPQGTVFSFEMGAKKLAGVQGYADVGYRGRFAWEYKGTKANLEDAYHQVLQYREALDNPPLLITCDLGVIDIHTNFTNTPSKTIRLSLNDLLTPVGLETLKNVFYNPEALRPDKTADQVTQEAAARLSRIADILRDRGNDPELVAKYLTRLFFCLYAEDIGLLPPNLFTNLLSHTQKRPAAFTTQVKALFGVMKTGGWFGTDEILEFGEVFFGDDAVVEIPVEGLEILASVTKMDWRSLKPSIMGVLFERGLDPAKRAQLGAHYTSEEDILTVIEPVLMRPLRRRWETVQAKVQGVAEKRNQAATRQQRDKLTTQIKNLLMDFAEEITAIRVLDPACGSGNFLCIALRQLLGLQKEVISLSAALGIGQFMPTVSPTRQLFGMELNEYAYRMAQATIQMGYIQWLVENGFGFPDEPIIKQDHIVQKDAVLGWDASGMLLQPEWPGVDVIVGNPPFLGGNKIRAELGDGYVDNLFRLYQGRVPAFADLVCYWFEVARSQLVAGKAKRVGLLATQAIRFGANRSVLDQINQTGRIFWAYSDRDWILDGATVHVAMVGFDQGEETQTELNGQPVSKVNPDLTSMVDITCANPLIENRGICFMGASPKGPFDIDEQTAQELLTAPLNVNGRPNSDVVRPVASAIDLVQKPRGIWTVDFGLLGKTEAAQYEKPFQYALAVVFPIRSQNRRAAYAEKWWQYAEARPGMRAALAGLNRFIATPGVSKHRIFIWVPPEVLCNQGTLVFARSDDYFFGVLQSRPHELWARGMGSQLREAESGFRYTPTTTFETFPLPWPPRQELREDPCYQAIAQAACNLNKLRQRWQTPPDASPDENARRTLTRLYNEQPAWLVEAHRALDQAVMAAYGWPPDLPDEDILTRLLALNQARPRNP